MKNGFFAHHSVTNSDFGTRSRRSGGRARIALSYSRRAKKGVAIIVVLLFVVLLSGIVLAFFARSLSSRKISDSNADHVKTELFANGAVEFILGDLRQEIVTGSVTPTSFADGSKLYVPSGSTNMVPQRVGTADALPNLVKRSVSGQPMYTLQSGAGPARASSVSTETESLNGRAMTASRWNKPYLLPKQDPSSSTSAIPVTAFTSPDWIYVSRDGSNPVSWNANLSLKGTKPVLARYAYCIYDEGGLLNANVAGFPTGTTGLSEEQKCLKGGVPLADLSEILGGNTGGAGFSSTRTNEIINQLLGWRNYATLQPTGTFPTFTLTSGTGDAYSKYISSQSKGFLKVGNTSLFNAQSDRAFSSRQELIKFLHQGLAADSGERAKFQNALQYLGTFSRDIDQPSYVPASGRPKVKATLTAGGNSILGGDDVVNPSFLNVRVTGSFTRNDGTTAQDGEPLVKKRFALARLAWITYAGPSADRSGLSSPSSAAGSADYDLWLLKNKYGVTEDFLRQGTAANIHKYLGLSWVTDPDNPSSKLWVYSHQGTTPLTAASSAPVSTIRTLAGGSNNVLGREADFFELLKASVHAGSMAKAYTAPTDSANPYGGMAYKPRVYAATKDADFDSAVVQLGANILSQSSTSGFPVRIMFNNGLFGKIQQYRGVADLPYFYRVREGKLIVKQPIVSATGGPFTLMENLPKTNATVTDPGRVMGLQEPEIWNPHAWNSIRGDTLFRPTEFRVIAVTQDPNGNATAPISIAGGYNYTGRPTYLTSVDAIPPVPLTSEQLTPVNTEMLFEINPNFDNLFREPTVLIKPGVPLNSNLRIGAGHTIKSELGADYILTPKGFSWFIKIPGNKVTDNKQYIGVVIARNLPAAFSVTNLGGGANGNGVLPTGKNQLLSGDGITYRMQYKDPSGNWVTYDEKFAPVLCADSYTYTTLGTGGQATTNTYSWGDQNLGSEWGSTCFDPRTGRFGMLLMGKNGFTGGGTIDFPVTVRNYAMPLGDAYLAGWSLPSPALNSPQAAILPYMQRSANQMTLWTNRPDECAGFVLSTWANGQSGLATGPSLTNMGWYPGAVNTMTPTGMTCQNNPATNTVTAQVYRFLTDGQLNSPPGLRGFADPDGVMRRGMSAYVPLAAPNNPAVGKPASGGATGLPMRTAYVFSADNSGTIQDIGEAASRPVILNRPFRSVAELGYVFSGTPWRNVDFFTPESGNSAFLDVFCVDVNDNDNALTDGRTNLNTRHVPVLRAILANAYQDAFSPSSTVTRLQSISGSASADAIARALISRTSDTSTTGAGPLQNVSELVGKWNATQTIPTAASPFNIDGSASYTGFSGTTTTSGAPLATPANLSSVLASDTSKDGYTACTNQRYRESVIRSLSAAGQTRVWNLMIDVVAQTGLCTENASDLSKFTVKGEQRYWVHVAIDRYTGAILDKQMEVVTE